MSFTSSHRVSAVVLLYVIHVACGDVDATPPAPPRDGGWSGADAPPAPDGPAEDDGGALCDGVECSDMDDACNVGSCDPATGTCETEPRADGTACDDGAPCTTDDACATGACAGTPVDCSPMADVCNTAACDPSTGACARAPAMDGTTCDDASGCTTGDVCTAGACAGTAIDCSSLTTGCAVGACNAATGACEATNAPDGAACDDMDVCTTADACVAGTCVGASVPQCNVMCSRARAVADGTMLPGQDVGFGMDDLTFTGCGTSAYNALYYAITIPAGQGLTVRAQPLSSSFGTSIRLLPACGATTCLGSSNNGLNGQEDDLYYPNHSASPTDVVIAIGSSSSTVVGSFDLSIDLSPLPANRACGSAMPLAAGGSLTDQQAGFGGDDLTFTACGSSTYRSLYYALRIPAGQTLVATAIPRGDFDTSMRLLPACGATTCLASANQGTASGEPDVVYYANAGTAPLDAVLAVGGDLSTAFGPFDLSVRFEPPPSNRTCAGAIDVADGARLTNQLGATGVDNISFTGCGAAYRVLYYRATVPAGSSLEVIATPHEHFDAEIDILPACGATSCLAAATGGTAGDPQRLSYANAGPSAIDVVMAVGSDSATLTGTFDLAVEIEPLPANRLCSGATAVTDGAHLLDQRNDVGVENLTFSGCGSSLYRALYYTATIPAGQAIVVHAQPNGFNSVLRLLTGCGATTCYASANPGTASGSVDALVYENASGAPQAAVIAVGSSSATTSGTFDLSVDFEPIPAQRMCTMPVTVADGARRFGEVQGLGTDDVTFTGCGSSAYNVLYYAATVHPGERLVAGVTPRSYWNPVLRLLPDCTSTTCVASSNVGLSAEPERVEHTNTTAVAESVILAAGSASSTASGVFDLAVEVTTAAPAASHSPMAIAAACDDLTGATGLAGVLRDDAASPITALPFAFEIGGEPLAWFSAVSNGHMQLFPAARAATMVAYVNEALPTDRMLAPAIFPLWDDFVPTPTSAVRVATLGASPDRRFVVEWRDWEFAASGGGVVTYQVKLYESTNVIELHYCSLPASAPGSGSSATIGVQSTLGVRSYQHSYNTAGSVVSGSAIRLTPVP